MAVEHKEPNTTECGPHCGIKDKYSGHCADCHYGVAHGNARPVQGDGQGRVTQWETQ